MSKICTGCKKEYPATSEYFNVLTRNKDNFYCSIISNCSNDIDKWVRTKKGVE